MLEAVLLFVLFVRGVGLCSSGFSSCVPVWRRVTPGEGQPAVEHLLLVAPCRLGPGVRRTAVRVRFHFLSVCCLLSGSIPLSLSSIRTAGRHRAEQTLLAFSGSRAHLAEQYL